MRFLHHRIGSSVLVLLVAAALAGSGCNGIFGQTIDELLELFARDFRTVRLSKQKTIISAIGRGAKKYAGKPGEMARQFIDDNGKLLGLTDKLDDLRLIEEHARPLGTNVEFQQVVANLPVENGQIQINFDQEGHVVQIVNSYTSPTGALDQTNVSKERAAETAINEFLRTTFDNPSNDEQEQQKNPSGRTVSREHLKLREDPKIDDVFFARDGRLHRAYRILVTAELPFGIKQFVIDANSNEILDRKNFVFNQVDGRGQVFMPNPVNSQNNPALFTKGDRGDLDLAVSTNNPNPYFTVPLMGLEASNGQFMLRGRFVELVHIEGSPANTPPQKSNANDFMFTRFADEFEEVMIYFHIDRMQRYIQEKLLFTNVMNRRLRADAHGVAARYVATTPGQGYIAFGDAGTDDAEDGDVIAHEYGHAIQDNQAPGEYSGDGEPRAMGEGFGDYWAFSSNFDDTIANEYIVNGHDDRCLMEWEVVATPPCRRVDDGPPASSFSFNLVEWENGRIWSRTLFEIFKVFGKIPADKLILQSHFNFAGNTFRAGADAIMTADQQISAGVNKPRLCQIFVDRGIYTAADCPS